MKSAIRRSSLALLAPLLLVAGQARAALELNMPRGVSKMSEEIYGLHMLIFWVCVVIGVVVFGVMIWSLIYHRHSRGAKPAQFHESTTVEIAWTIVPFIILIAMAIPAAGTLLKLEDASHPDMTIKVTGYQWMWEYEYLEHDVNFFSRMDNATNEARQLDSGIDPNTVEHYLRDVDKYVVVPVGQKVRLLLASNDVIHAWWVPELTGKKDAIPGYINEMWFKAEKTGVYRGQCAELCGRGHAYMPIVVEVVEQDEYEAWVAEQGGSMTADAGESEAAATQVAAASNSATDAAVDSEPAGSSNEAGAATETDTEAATDSDVASDAGASPDASEQAATQDADDQAADAGEAVAAMEDEAQSAMDKGMQMAESGAAAAGSAMADAKAKAEGAMAAAAAKGEEAVAGMSKEVLMTKGKAVYDGQCAACHQADGSGMAAAGFPAMKGSPVANGDLGEHIKQVLDGVGAMPPYRDTLDDEEIAAVITYERNAFGNETGDVVQPSTIADAR